MQTTCMDPRDFWPNILLGNSGWGVREAFGLIWERAEWIVYKAAFKPVLSNFPIPILILNLSTSPDTDFQSESLSLILVSKILVSPMHEKFLNQKRTSNSLLKNSPVTFIQNQKVSSISQCPVQASSVQSKPILSKSSKPLGKSGKR